MKSYKFNIDGRELRIRFDERNGRVLETLVDGKAPDIPAEEMPCYAVAISLALLEKETAVMHDDETDVITLGHKTSRWANPADTMSERGSLLKQLLGW